MTWDLVMWTFTATCSSSRGKTSWIILVYINRNHNLVSKIHLYMGAGRSEIRSVENAGRHVLGYSETEETFGFIFQYSWIYSSIIKLGCFACTADEGLALCTRQNIWLNPLTLLNCNAMLQLLYTYVGAMLCISLCFHFHICGVMTWNWNGLGLNWNYFVNGNKLTYNIAERRGKKSV